MKKKEKECNSKVIKWIIYSTGQETEIPLKWDSTNAREIFNLLKNPPIRYTACLQIKTALTQL